MRLGDADEAAAQVGEVVGIVAGFVEQHDEVDVGGVVELARAHLAHREHEHAGAVGGVLGVQPGSLPRAISCGERGGAAPSLHGAVGERGQRAGHRVEVPGPAEVGERDQQRRAALGDAQAGGPAGCRRAIAARIAAIVVSGALVSAARSQSASRAMRPAEKARTAGGAGEEVARPARAGRRTRAAMSAAVAGSCGRGARAMRSARRACIAPQRPSKRAGASRGRRRRPRGSRGLRPASPCSAASSASWPSRSLAEAGAERPLDQPVGERRALRRAGAARAATVAAKSSSGTASQIMPQSSACARRDPARRRAPRPSPGRSRSGAAASRCRRRRGSARCGRRPARTTADCAAITTSPPAPGSRRRPPRRR